MSNLIFDLQRFDEVTILAGDTYALDGVTYTALEDAQLNLDDGKISGIASGSVTATVTGAKTSSTLTLDATNGSTDFTLTGNDKVLTLTKVLPFELDNGTFTLAGNVLTAAKGSDLRIGSGRTYADGTTVFGHDYADTDITYTITDTTLTEETEQETIIFTASLGDRARSITTLVSGKIINGLADDKFTGGLTVTKGSSIGLTLGDYIIKATANADATSYIFVDSEGINITPGSGDGTLNVALIRDDKKIFAGDLECTGGKITFGYDQAVTFAKGTSFNFTVGGYTLTATTTDEATTAISLTDNGISFTPGSGDGGLSLLFTKNGTPIFGGVLNVTNGTITFDSTTQKFSFTEGTKISLGMGDGSQSMDFEIVGGDASFKMAVNPDGSFTITPDKNDGSLDISLKQNGTTVFQNTLTATGSMIINPVTKFLTLTDGTSVSLAFNNYTFTATASGDATSAVSWTADGLSYTPQTGDGTLNLKLGSAQGSMSVDVEVLSGGFRLGSNGSLKVDKDTELQIDFGDGYIVNFKATDDAGGSLVLGKDGITFAPNEGDGGLELSVTRNGQTRTASLDVTGSITYKLDGSISIAKGTVITNKFESGRTLTITANTDASGSIVFSPQRGLDITPATPDALTVSMSSEGAGDLIFTSITGTINYNGGLVTAYDGASAHIVDETYTDYSVDLSVVGGTASIFFGLVTGDVYIANDGSTLIWKYPDGTTFELQNGSLTSIYGDTMEDNKNIISAGATLKNNDDNIVFTLEKAGNYTLNGIEVTTTKDNTEVVLSNYDTVIVDGISYTPLDENVTLTIGEDSTTTVSGGKVNLTIEGMGTRFNFDTTDGALSYDATTRKLSLAKGGIVYLQKDNFVLQLVAKENVSAEVIHTRFEMPYFGWDGKPRFELDLINNDKTLFSGDLTFSGGIGTDATTGTFGLIDSNTHNIHDSYAELAVGNYKINLATDGDTSYAVLDLDSDEKIILDYINENYSSPKLTVSNGDEQIFSGSLDITGQIVLDNKKQAVTLTDGSSISVNLNDYTLKITADGDATSALGITQDGLTITPNTGDGTLQLEIGNGNASMTADLEVLSGGFRLGSNGSLKVDKDTELQIDFGDGYIVNFKATDDAGGSLVLGKDGITFAPNEGDGGLELSVTRNGQTRTASLDVTGSITYKLDGSISLTKGTVVTNKFESGRTLTITANTDASGSIIFSPEGGLTITPATSDALTLQVINGANYWFFDEITGSITYSRDKIVLADDTTFKGVVAYEDGTHILGGFSFGSEGGETTLKFGSYIIEATPASGAATTLNNSATGHGWKLSSGSITLDASNNTMIYKLIAGSEIVGDIPGVSYRLTETGNYTLNGMNIATTKDNVQVLLTNYDTVTFEADAGIVFDGQEFSGDGLITLTDGALTILNADDNVAVNGTASDDRITNIGDNVTISALGGNDTIYSGGNGVKIDGGAGSNLVSLFGGNKGSEIVFDGVTTVEGFKTGWGSGSDTVYIKAGSDPGVDFKTDGLTFYDGNDSLTLADVDDTAKVYLYYEASNTTGRNVYIARNDWYSVESGDLNGGEGIYFVGTSATHNHGVDFSGVSQALNVTMNTDYDAANNSIWVNNVYSIRGGAGNTTITGTADSDTIIAGSGNITIDGAGGNDRISLGSAAALVKYTTGGGNDSIIGFNGNSTLSIGGGRYSSATSGDDLILTVGADKVTLFGAASLDSPNILGTSSGGGSSTSDDDKKSLLGVDDLYSIGTGGKLVTTPPNPGSGTPYTGSKDRGITVSKPTATITPSLSGSSIQEIWRAMVGISNVTSSGDAIYAGGDGSQLWGDSDTIFAAGAEDTINLPETTLDQITNVNDLGAGDGNSFIMVSDPAQVANFKLADSSAYPRNNATDTWTKTN